MISIEIYFNRLLESWRPERIPPLPTRVLVEPRGRREAIADISAYLCPVRFLGDSVIISLVGSGMPAYLCRMRLFRGLSDRQ